MLHQQNIHIKSINYSLIRIRPFPIIPKSRKNYKKKTHKIFREITHQSLHSKSRGQPHAAVVFLVTQRGIFENSSISMPVSENLLNFLTVARKDKGGGGGGEKRRKAPKPQRRIRRRRAAEGCRSRKGSRGRSGSAEAASGTLRAGRG